MIRWKKEARCAGQSITLQILV